MANYDLTYEGSRVQGILDTGDELRDAGYIFRGEATPSTVPGTPTERVAYIGGPGTYTNFGSSITVGAGCICIFKYTGSAWSNQVIDTGLSDAINSEASARQLGDSTLQGGINTVSAAITAINNAIGNGCVYAGIATPSSTPASGKVFYFAFTAGTYTNFNSLEVPQGINILKNNGSTWLLDSFSIIDDAPTQGSANLVKSGGVLNSIIQNGPAFDLSAYNAQEGVLATYADLNAALTALNALPSDFKKGGMSMKFVLTSDNKYVQWRLMADTFSTTETDWQSVDDEPTAGSDNLVKSGGVANALGIKLPETVIKYDSVNNILAENNGILNSDGVSSPGNVNYLYSNFVDLVNVTQLITKANYYSADSGLLFYNANKEYISSVLKDPVVFGNTELTINKNDFPSEAAYIRINFMSPSTGAGDYYLKIITEYPSHEIRINNLERSIDDLSISISNIEQETNSLEESIDDLQDELSFQNIEITNYGLFSTTIQSKEYQEGVLVDNTSIDSILPVLLDKENDIYIYSRGNGSRAVFFDENLVYISQILGVNNNTPVRITDFPVNAKYIAFSWPKANLLSDVFATRTSYVPQMGWKIYSDIKKIKKTRPKVPIYKTDSESVILQKLVKAYITKDCDVSFEFGEYAFQQVYSDMVDVWDVGSVQGSYQRELPLGANCTYDFNGSTITGTLPQGISDGKIFGSMRTAGQNYTLRNGILINNGMVYAIHDEGQNEEGFYQHDYQNLEVINNGGTSGMGIGSGLSGVVNIKNCIFKGNDDTKAAISGHGINQTITDEAYFEVNIANSWINTSVNLTSKGVNQVAKLIISGCSVKSLYVASNWDKYYFCNEVRV